MKRLFHLRNDIRGQAMIEFAIILPILIMVIVGIISYGLYINANTTVQQAAEIGARTASIGDYAWVPWRQRETAVERGWHPDRIRRRRRSVEPRRRHGTEQGCSSASPAPTIVQSSSSPSAANSMVTVTVTVTYHPVVPFPGLLPSTTTLQQSYSMMMQTLPPSNGTSPAEPTTTATMVSTTTCN